MTYPSTFHGWLAHDKTAAQGTMTWASFLPKPFNDIDIDIKITHCGFCGSDLHTLRSGWSNTLYPICVGHDIVGHDYRLGYSVSYLQLVNSVGVG